MEKKIICLLGATATGKTDTALYIADHLPIHIISVDSALIYQGMDIGTAKPEKEILSRYPHALIDICSPLERYSAARFRKDAVLEIEKAFQHQKIPLLVGGTFLYFQALLEGLSPIPPVEDHIAKGLDEQWRHYGNIALHQELLNVDPESGARINASDTQRLLRALGVYRSTGKTLTYFWSLPKTKFPYPTLKIELRNPDIKRRNERIAKRYHQMIDTGLVDEVKKIMTDFPALNLNFPSMRAVGYRQIWEYLHQEHTLDQAIELAIIATRQYAKRQRTWLRSEPSLIPFDVTQMETPALILAHCQQFSSAKVSHTLP